MLSLGAKERYESGGIRAAFEREISPLLSPLEKYCRSIARSRWDADDLLQDTLEKAYARFRQTGGAPMNKAYVCRIASNAWIDRARRARESVVPADWPGFERMDRAEDGREEEARRAVERVVAALTSKQRTALLLCDALACSLQEAADRLGMTVGSVKSLLHRARASARRDGCGGEEEGGASADAALVDAYVLALRAGSVDRVVALGRADVGGSGADARLGAKVARDARSLAGTAAPWARAAALPARAAAPAARLAGFAAADGTAAAALRAGSLVRVVALREGDAIAA